MQHFLHLLPFSFGVSLFDLFVPLELLSSISFIAIKQDFRNGNFVFCVIGNEISLEFIPKNLFYDYTLFINRELKNMSKTSKSFISLFD